MSPLQAALFGALQGLTEFLPVSSSGHLAVLKDLWGFEEVPILFDVLLHVATLLVTLFVFRERVWRIIAALLKGIFRNKEVNEEDRVQIKTALIIILASALTAIFGFGLKDLILPSRLISVGFILTAFLLISTRFIRQGSKSYRGLGWKDGLITGIAQGIGVIPGISRSGITISAGLMSGMDRQTAGEFSFILSLPSILGALILSLKDAGELGQSVPPLSLLAGFLSAAAFGFVALLLLMRFVRSGKLHWFAVYLIPLGIAGLIFF